MDFLFCQKREQHEVSLRFGEGELFLWLLIWLTQKKEIFLDQFHM